MSDTLPLQDLRQRENAELRLAGLLCLSAVVLTALTAGGNVLGALATAGIVLIALAPPVLAARGFRTPLSNPTSIFALVVLMWTVPSFLRPERVNELLGSSSRLPSAELLILLSLGLYSVTLALAVRRQPAHPVRWFQVRKREVSDVAWPGLLAAYFLGWLGRVAASSFGVSHIPSTLRGGTNILGLLSDLDLIAQLAFAFLLAKSLRQRLYVLVVPLVLLEAAAGFISGGRRDLLERLVVIAVVVSIVWRPFTLRAGFVGLAVLLGVLLPVLTVYRSNYYNVTLSSSVSPARAALKSGAATVSSLLSGQESNRTLAEAGSDAQLRLYTLLSGSIRVIERVPSRYEWAKGESFLVPSVTSFIPRAVWPDKPETAPGREFAVVFFDRRATGSQNSIGIGMPAEAYYNFGLLGPAVFVILGSALAGLTRRIEIFRRSDSQVDLLLWTIFVSTTFVTVRSSFAVFVPGIIRNGATIVIFSAVVCGGVRFRRLA